MLLGSFVPQGSKEIRIGAVTDDKGSLLDLNAAYALCLRDREEEPLPNRLADAALPPHMISFIRMGEKGLARAQKSIAFFTEIGGSRETLDPLGRRLFYEAREVKLRVPIPDPPETLWMAFTAGGTYEGAKKIGVYTPKELPVFPAWFHKSHSLLTDPGDYVIRPSGCRALMPSTEFAVVISRRAFRISPDEVYDYIFGYTLGHDVSAIDFFPKEHLLYCLERNKSFATFAPIGPYIATKDEVSDPHNLQLDTYVGEKLCLSVNTSAFERKLEELIPFIAMHEPLEAGTILMMGGLPGVTTVTADPGQTMSTTMWPVGTLSNPVVSDEEAVSMGLVPRTYEWPGEVSYYYKESPTGPLIWTIQPEDHD